jgi:hypothetical protein
MFTIAIAKSKVRNGVSVSKREENCTDKSTGKHAHTHAERRYYY